MPAPDGNPRTRPVPLAMLLAALLFSGCTAAPSGRAGATATDAGTAVPTTLAPSSTGWAWTRPTYIGSQPDSGGVACRAGFGCLAGESSGSLLAATLVGRSLSSWRVVRRGVGGAAEAVACAPSALCIAVYAEAVAASPQPFHPGSAWRRTPLPVGFRASASCPTSSLCLIGGSGGIIYSSRDPLSRSARWSAFNLNTAIPGYDSGIDSLTCPSKDLCLAGGSPGVMYWTRDPGADPPTWQAAIEADSPIDALSCPSAGFCVAGTSHGRLLWSTDPASLDPLWRSRELRGKEPISSLSCPSTSSCTLGSAGGPLIWSPKQGPDGALSHMKHPDPSEATSLACPSVRLCLEIDFEGRLVIGSAS